MNFVALVRLALNSISLLLLNPNLGGRTNIRVTQAAELLDTLDALIEEGEDAYEDLRAFAEEVKAIAEAGRSPTPDEWEGMRARRMAAHDRLQAVKEEILAGQQQETPPAESTAPVETPPQEGSTTGEVPPGGEAAQTGEGESVTQPPSSSN